MAIDYGIDIAADPDVDPMFATVSGRDVLVQAILRRLETPRGSLFYDSDYGLDLRSYIGEMLDSTDIFQLQSDIANECLKDERLQAAQARVAYNAQTETMTVILLLRDGLGPFKRVLTVDQVTVGLLAQAA